MKRLLVIAYLLAFAPIVIDEMTMNQIMAAAHQNMRGIEYDWMSALFKNLEENALKEAAKPKTDQPHPEKFPVPAEPEK